MTNYLNACRRCAAVHPDGECPVDAAIRNLMRQQLEFEIRSERAFFQQLAADPTRPPRRRDGYVSRCFRRNS
jgi:hypothetical protein